VDASGEISLAAKNHSAKPSAFMISHLEGVVSSNEIRSSADFAKEGEESEQSVLAMYDEIMKKDQVKSKQGHSRITSKEIINRMSSRADNLNDNSAIPYIKTKNLRDLELSVAQNTFDVCG